MLDTISLVSHGEEKGVEEKEKLFSGSSGKLEGDNWESCINSGGDTRIIWMGFRADFVYIW